MGEGGGDREWIAPVIPLFGGGADAPQRKATDRGRGAAVEAEKASVPEDEPEGEEPLAWSSTWDSEPVVSIGSRRREDPTDDAHTTGAGDTADTPDAGDVAEAAEKLLLKRLRGRSLSIREARDLLTREGVDNEAAEVIVAVFIARGYLDDAALAEQIVHVGLDRKGQGRLVIAQSLAKRGIPRDVADAALLALPDDDRERALEFARSKARALSTVDPDAALRRLTGQLARRGYGGSLAVDVAREALREAGGSRRFGAPTRGSSGVRFVED